MIRRYNAQPGDTISYLISTTPFNRDRDQKPFERMTTQEDPNAPLFSFPEEMGEHRDPKFKWLIPAALMAFAIGCGLIFFGG